MGKLANEAPMLLKKDIFAVLVRLKYSHDTLPVRKDYMLDVSLVSHPGGNNAGL